MHNDVRRERYSVVSIRKQEVVCATRGAEVVKNGSPGRIRTSDQPVNSRLLYH